MLSEKMEFAFTAMVKRVAIKMVKENNTDADVPDVSDGPPNSPKACKLLTISKLR
jgi:hypothetical protein